LGVQQNMHTVVETAEFQKQTKAVWSDAEREALIDWIAANPDAGAVIPGADGARKVRWSRAGKGKRGGVRVIYTMRVRASWNKLWACTSGPKPIHLAI
jgi:mRNA-degrading endonuclease RelE of RelBE toxin-antitoxin system